jgi:hypothetical protein
MSAACTECGNDDPTEGYDLCSDCLEASGSPLLEVDAGVQFGTWPDPTSRLIYQDAMPALLSGIARTGTTLDLGGGNGLSRQWFDQVHTVDADPGKQPDEVADALTYVPDTSYDRVLLRYVLHYLRDGEVVALLQHVATYHHGPVVLVQFVNDDLDAKYANSVNERKHFRTEDQVIHLLSFAPWRVHQRIAVEYEVHPDFYRHRLGHPNPTGHRERVVAYLLEPTSAVHD